MKRLSSLIFSALFSLLFAAGASLCAAESPAFSIENRSPHLMNGSAFVSSVATTGSKGTKLQADGAAASGWAAESPAWDTATVEDGYHTLALSEGDSASAEVLVINDAGVVIHDGTLEADEENLDRYFAVSDQFDDVVYDFNVIDNSVLYWGGEYDYYEKAA